MDQFSQQVEAVRLLAATAIALRTSTRKVHAACKARPHLFGRLGHADQTLLQLTQGAIQLVAAAYDISQLLEQQTHKSTRSTPAKPRSRPAKCRKKPRQPS